MWQPPTLLIPIHSNSTTYLNYLHDQPLHIFIFKCITLFFAAVRSQSPVIFSSRIFDQIFCYVWLSCLTGDDENDLGKFIDSFSSKLKDTKNFDSKILLEHVVIKLRLDVLRFRKVRLSAIQARSFLISILRQFPSNPILLQSLFTRTEFRPSVADQFWREAVKVKTVLV